MEAFVERLVKCGAVQFGEFTLRSGLKSDYYVDIKKAATKYELLKNLATYISSHLDGRVVYGRKILYAGVELGAVPLVVACALNDRLNYVIIRKASKDHGTQRRIEGDFEPGAQVILLEDVVTTGGASADAVEVLREAGLQVIHIVAVVDRQQGGRELFDKLRIPFSSLITADELLLYRSTYLHRIE